MMSTRILILLFLAGSAVIVYVSRASLRAPQSHGFSRFFAWEFILALVVLNLSTWFAHPFSLSQIISWILLILSIGWVVMGISILRKLGKPHTTRQEDTTLFDFEKTSTLVTVGVYHYIRHPLYSSLLFLAWGVFFKSPSWMDGLLAFFATGFLIRTAQADEAECLRFFGPAYQTYMQHTKRFVPYLF